MGLSNLIDLLRFGHQVENPATWKTVGAASPVIALAVDNLLKLSEAHGYALNLTPDLHDKLILAIAGVVMFIVQFISSRKAGLLPAKPGGYGAEPGPSGEGLRVQQPPMAVPNVQTPPNLGGPPVSGEPDLTA